jgi:hypothetical protein
MSPTAQGRLTLTSGVPFLTADVTAAATIYYTPAVGNQLPIWNGVDFAATTFAEISQALSDATKSPAASAANSNYDLFVWIDTSTITLSRGPAWASDTTRGTGAGTTELKFLNGIYVNANLITNGPSANNGTYVGTIRTNASNSVDMMFAPAGATGGTANHLFVWNMYNRRRVSSVNFDTTASWVYSTATWREKNASASNQTSFICGIAEDAFRATNTTVFSGNAAGTNGECNIGLDSTTVPATHSQGGIGISVTSALDVVPQSSLDSMPSIGFHFVAALERAGGIGTLTWHGWRTTVTETDLPLTFVWSM